MVAASSCSQLVPHATTMETQWHLASQFGMGYGAFVMVWPQPKASSSVPTSYLHHRNPHHGQQSRTERTLPRYLVDGCPTTVNCQNRQNSITERTWPPPHNHSPLNRNFRSRNHHNHPCLQLKTTIKHVVTLTSKITTTWNHHIHSSSMRKFVVNSLLLLCNSFDQRT